MRFLFPGVGEPEEDLAWHLRAACADPAVDPEVFTKPLVRRGRPGASYHPPTWKYAKEVCDRCPVLTQCLKDTLSRPPEGDAGRYFMFAGGLAPDELTALRRRMEAKR